MRVRRSRVFAVVIAIFVFLHEGCFLAFADTLSANTSVRINGDLRYANTVPSSSTFLNNIAGSGSAFAIGATQSVSATFADFNPSPAHIVLSGGSEANLSYSLTVYGPSGVQIPILFSGALYSNVQGTGITASAQESITGQFGEDNFSYSVCTQTILIECYGNSVPHNIEYVNKRLYIENGHSFAINLAASVIGSYSFFSGSGNAGADPYATVDPNFIYANQVRLVFSGGVGNAPLQAVPEPQTWLLLVAGFGLIGAALRAAPVRGFRQGSGTVLLAANTQ